MVDTPVPVKERPRRGHRPPVIPGASTSPRGEVAPVSNVGVDRGRVVLSGVQTVAQWSGRFLLIAAALFVLVWALGQLWVGVLPVLLALILATVLWPPVAWMTAKGLPAVLAAGVTLLVSFGVLFGVLAAIAPQMLQQSQEIGVAALEGVDEVQEWLAGPPLNLDTEQVDDGIERAITWLRDQSADIASGVFTGVTSVGSGLVTIGLVLVLTFFFLKDGPAFLPWLRTLTGRTAGLHLTEVLTRNWRTLGGFIRTQAVVSAVDAVFIGAGLLLLGVPLAFALALLTFFAGFIPIVGAVTAGALAVLVALVSNGWQVALTVLGLVVLVQQLESNVLQPALQGRTMQMHAGIILLSVAIGGTIFGIVGAFLAVPLSACLVVTLRYVSEQVDLRAGDQDPEDLPVMTPEGDLAKTEGAQSLTNHTGDGNKAPAGHGRAHPKGRRSRLSRVLRR